MPKLSKRYPLTLTLYSVILLFVSLMFLPGCSLKSGPKSFDLPKKSHIRPAPEAAETLDRAFEKTSKEGKKFYFSGWAGTKIQKRSIGYYITGSYDKEKGYSLDARIFGQPFRFYRWQNDVYISEGEKWRKISPSQVPLEPFTDFNKLQFLADKAVRDHDDKIDAQTCSKYVITLDADGAVEAAKAMGVDLSPSEKDLSDPYFKQLKMKIFIWVGQKDNLIYKYMTQTSMPIPGAGSFFQEISFKFWKYNNPGLNHPGPEKLEPYLIKD